MFPLVAAVTIAACLAGSFIIGALVGGFANSDVVSQVTVVICLLASIPVIVRAWRTGIWSDGEMMVSRMVFRTVKLPWSQINSIDESVTKLVARAVTDQGSFPIAASRNPLGEVLYGSLDKVLIEHAKH